MTLTLTPAEKGQLTRLLREHRKLAGGYPRLSISIKAAARYHITGCPFWTVWVGCCQRQACDDVHFHADDPIACRVASSPAYGMAADLWGRFAETQPERFAAWARREGLEVVG